MYVYNVHENTRRRWEEKTKKNNNNNRRRFESYLAMDLTHIQYDLCGKVVGKNINFNRNPSVKRCV